MNFRLTPRNIWIAPIALVLATAITGCLDLVITGPDNKPIGTVQKNPGGSFTSDQKDPVKQTVAEKMRADNDKKAESKALFDAHNKKINAEIDAFRKMCEARTDGNTALSVNQHVSANGLVSNGVMECIKP